MYKILIIANENLKAFEDRLKNGDLEGYKIIDASFNGVATLFVLEKEEA